MKKIFFPIACSCLMAFAANANDAVTVSDQVKQLFTKEFASAQAVTWMESGDYIKASFVIGGHRAEAYFNAAGELEGCIRDLFFDQLPLSVMTAVDKRFANADILEVREVSNSEGTHYRVNLEFEGKKFAVKILAGGNIAEVEKIKK